MIAFWVPTSNAGHFHCQIYDEKGYRGKQFLKIMLKSPIPARLWVVARKGMAFTRWNIHSNKKIWQCWVDIEDGDTREQIFRESTGIDGFDKVERAGLHRRGIALWEGIWVDNSKIGSDGIQVSIQPHEGKAVRGMFVGVSSGVVGEPEVQFDQGGHSGEGNNVDTLILNN